MNAIDLKKPTPSASTNEDGTIIGVWVSTPHRTLIALFLVSPLRRIFRVALKDQIIQWLGACGHDGGVFIGAKVRDVDIALPIILNELNALHYEKLSHVGKHTAGGWRFLYGSPEFVSLFDTFCEATRTETPLESQLVRDHCAAACNEE